MASEGYIKLYRKSIDNGWLRNPELWTFWCWCLLKATHKDCVVMVGYQRVELKSGQFIFGRQKASEELNLSERKIRTCLDSLRKRKNVTIKTTNKFSVISLVNWDTYQVNTSGNDQQNDQPLTSKRPASDHKQECKELKNVKKKESGLPLPANNSSSNPSVKAFIDWYHARFLEQFGEKPKIEGGKDGAIVKRLLHVYDLPKLIELGEEFFSSDDEFIQKTGYTLGVFSSVINKLIAGKTKSRDPTGGRYSKGPDEWLRIRRQQRKERGEPEDE